MQVTHAFTSAKSDGADATLVQPSNWNANHTIAANTITASPATDQNDYAPTGWSTADFVRLTPTASVVVTGWSAGNAGEQKILANLSTDKIVVLAHQNASSSAANRISVDAAGSGHQILLPGEEARLIYDGASSRWRIAEVNSITASWVPRGTRAVAGAISLTNLGLALTQSATYTVRAIPTTPASYIEAVPRAGNQTTTSSGNTITQRANGFHVIQGNAAGRGGCYGIMAFGGDLNPSTAASRFIGLYGTVAAIGNVDASTLTNIIGIGHDPTQTTYRLLNNDGSGTATATDLGANFPVDTTSCFDFRLFTPPNGSSWAVSIWRTDDLTVTPKVFDLSTDIPANTQPLGFQLSCGNRAAGAAYATSFMYANFLTPN